MKTLKAKVEYKIVIDQCTHPDYEMPQNWEKVVIEYLMDSDPFLHQNKFYDVDCYATKIISLKEIDPISKRSRSIPISAE